MTDSLDAWSDFLAQPDAKGAWHWDPALMMRDLGLQPDPWQAEFLNMRYRRALLVCSRRCGKTAVAAIKALHHAMFANPQEPATVLIFSHAGKQTDEMIYHLHLFYDRLGRPVPRQTDRTTQLDFDNGSRIIAFKSNPDSVVGFTPTLIIIDEAARVEDKMFQAIAPMRALGKSQLIALSTPHGKRGWFYEEWSDPGRAWYRIRKTADDCPRIDRNIIEDDRKTFGDSYVRQEYYCSFESMAGLVYPDYESAVCDPCELRPARSYAGVDFGWHNPAAFLVGVLDRDDVLWIVHEIYGSKITDEELALMGFELVQRWGIQKTWCDTENPQSIEKLRRGNVPALPAYKAIPDGIRAVGARLRTGRLKIWRTCKNLVREMGLYHYDIEKTKSQDHPVDQDNHACDAIRYLVQGIDRGKQPHGATQRPEEKEPPPPTDYGPDGNYKQPLPQERYTQIPSQRRQLEEEERRWQQEYLDQEGWERWR